MKGFEYVFSLFGLLLGLSITEILSGFSRVMKARRHVRLGWLTPLLGLLLGVDLISFWSNAWEIRDYVPSGFGTLIFAALVASIYYLASSLVFPLVPSEWADLDDWYFVHRREVIGAVALANALMIVGMTLLLGNIYNDGPSAWIVPICFYAIALALVLIKNRLISTLLLILDISFYWIFRYL